MIDFRVDSDRRLTHADHLGRVNAMRLTAKTDQAKIEKRLAQAIRKERETATRLRRLVTALQGWQDERIKCEVALGKARVQAVYDRLMNS